MPFQPDREALRSAAERILKEARTDGRTHLNRSEQARYDDLIDELRELDDEAERVRQSERTIASLRRRTPAVADARHLVYRRGDPNVWQT